MSNLCITVEMVKDLIVKSGQITIDVDPEMVVRVEYKNKKLSIRYLFPVLKEEAV